MGWLKETFQSDTDSNRLHTALLSLANSYALLATGDISRSDFEEHVAASGIPALANSLRESEGERYVKSCVKSARSYAWKNVPNNREYIAIVCELTATSL
jgi:hypothetical protein